MTPNTHITVTLTNGISLEQALRNAKVDVASLVSLTVTGKFVGRDSDYIRDKMPALQGLNLSSVLNGNIEILNKAIELNAVDIWEERLFGIYFDNCTGLKSVTLPRLMTHFGQSTFEGCTGLTSIVIPDMVRQLGGWTFKGCTNLRSVTIPASLYSIYEDDFEGCINAKFTVHPDSPYFKVKDGMLYDKEKECFLRF